MRIKETPEVKFQVIGMSREEIRPLLKTNMSIAISNIIRIMEEKKVSQSDLGYAICSVPSHVSYMLSNNGKGITINVLGRIAKALAVTPDILLKKHVETLNNLT